MTGTAALAFARDLWRQMPRRVAAAGALSLAATALETAGVLLLARLLALAGVPAGEGSAGALARAVERAFHAVGARPALGPVLLAFVALTLAQALVQRAESLSTHAVEMEAGYRVRTRLYAALARAHWLPLARTRGADLLAGLTGEADRAGAAAAYALSLLVQGLLAAAYLALALRVSTSLTAVAFGSGALLLLLLRRPRAAARNAGERLSAVSADMVAAATEHLGALKTVKSHGAEERNTALFGAAALQAMRTHQRGWRAFADARAAFTVGSVALLAVVTYVALQVLRVPAGTVLVLVFLFYRLVPRLATMNTVWQMLAQALPAWEGLTARIAALEAEREELGPASERVHVRSGIHLEGVRFAYEPGAPNAVESVDLEIAANRTTALVGPSGAGKTTVADLVMGLVVPGQGRVTVDGRALDESWLRGWRESIGYVAQDAVLFNDTVLANLRWAWPDASDDEVWNALRMAAADGFVAALPDGIHTRLGDRGVRLSGGERQRLALARALLRRPALLILDEATSALDAENERRIRDAIGALHGQMTILIITHRLPSVRDADLIHVIDGGRVVESGSFPALMARPAGRFRRLWSSQPGEPIPDENGSA